MADRLRTTAIAIVDKLGQLTALALIFFHTLHNQLSQRPARSSPVPASTPPSSVGESCGPVAGNPFVLDGVARDRQGKLRARLVDTRHDRAWHLPFDEHALRFWYWPSAAASLHDDAMGRCLVLIANEKGICA